MKRMKAGDVMKIGREEGGVACLTFSFGPGCHDLPADLIMCNSVQEIC